jgi:hypothetical protein
MKAFCKPPKKPGEHPTAAVATTTTTRQTTSINIDSFLPINSTAHTTFVTISKYAFHSLFLQHWLCGQKNDARAILLAKKNLLAKKKEREGWLYCFRTIANTNIGSTNFHRLFCTVKDVEHHRVTKKNL